MLASLARIPFINRLLEKRQNRRLESIMLARVNYVRLFKGSTALAALPAGDLHDPYQNPLAKALNGIWPGLHVELPPKDGMSCYRLQPKDFELLSFGFLTDQGKLRAEVWQFLKLFNDRAYPNLILPPRPPRIRASIVRQAPAPSPT